MKKFLKWAGVAVLVPVVLFSSSAALFYFPPFQRWAVKQASAYASEKTNMDISVGNVRLKFPLDLQLNDVVAVTRGEPRDTIANIGSIVADVQMKPLLDKKVVIDELTFEKAKINTNGFIDAARVKGDIGKLRVTNSDILLNGKDDPTVSDVNLSDVLLADAKLDIVLPDSVPEDTTSSDTPWRIFAQKARIENSEVIVRSEGVKELRSNEESGSEGVQEFRSSDISSVKIGDATIENGFFDLKKGVYEVGKVDISKSGGAFGDYKIDDVALRADSISLADNRLKLRNAKIETPSSSISGEVDMALDALSPRDALSVGSNGTMKATVKASLSKEDLKPFMKEMPADFRKKWPEKPLEIDGTVRGNLQNMSFSDLNVSMPSAFRVKASGSLENMDKLDGLKADVDFDATATNVDFAKELLPKDVRKDVNIPKNLAVKGNLKADRQQYSTRFTAREGNGTLAGTAKFNAENSTYEASLNANKLALKHFAPNYDLGPLTANIDLKGQGTDFASPRTTLTAKADIKNFKYGDYDLSGLKADAKIKNGRALAQANLPNFSMGDSTMLVQGNVRLDIDSDLKNAHQIQGTVSDMTVKMKDGGKTTVYHPGDMDFNALATASQTRATVSSGDFHLDLDAKGNYERLLNAGDRLTAEVKRQYNERLIDQGRLRRVLPDAHLSINSGRNNFFVEMLNHLGYDVGHLSGTVNSSPVSGLNGRLHLESLMVDSMLLDTLNFAIQSDSVRTIYQAQIRNNEKNPQYTFNALIDGILQDRGTTFGTRLYDANGDLGLRVGVNATMENDGLMFRSHLKEPTLGYRKFKVNDDNFVFLGRDNRVSADLVLKADDGTGIQIYTNDDNLEAKQDITASLNHFDLEKILSVIPYTPDIKGMMNGDFHFVQTDNQVSVSSDLDIRQFVYENTPMGDLGTEFVYMPKNDGSHFIDGILNLNGNEFATLSGTYYNKKEKTKGYLDATVDLMRMPLSILNGFIPDQIFGFEGYGEGSLSVRGPISKPVVDGEIYLDSAYMVSQPYGVRLRFDNDPVTIKGSRLLFENFEMYANNSSPLTTYGALDFTDLDHMRLDLRLRAQNFLLIDAKENPRSEAYGKAYVNYYGNINGELSNLKMRGKLDVLGSTDLVYILRDSPLTTDNHLDELVRFVDFADTTQTVVHRPDLSGFTMDMTVDISKGAHVMSYLNADKSNFIDLTGGGTLRMNYGMSKKLSLMGRYTLANGEMKYSLPIIPLKTFTIKDGSYLEFTGNPMNPTLNITATERTRAAVSSENGVGRSVDFDCGVIITKTLDDMGLEFTLDAPEDMQLHSELQAMSTEQRGKLAVTMLTTGMYLADGNTQGFSMNQALNTFLQSEINNITGNALRTLDLSVGLDNTTDASGNVSTNYSFKFAKRFWNNRLKISIGGKVSSGAEVQNRNQSFFDNVTFEYRLDDTANKYVTLFYENNVYDWLDGYTQEYGVGFIWRRSLQHFKDIFNLKSDKQQQVMPSMMRRSQSSENPSDSTLKVRPNSLIIRQDSLNNEKDSIK